MEIKDKRNDIINHMKQDYREGLCGAILHIVGADEYTFFYRYLKDNYTGFEGGYLYPKGEKYLDHRIEVLDSYILYRTKKAADLVRWYSPFQIIAAIPANWIEMLGKAWYRMIK